MAFIGSINDEILNKDELASELLLFLWKAYPECIEKRYGIKLDSQPDGIVDAYHLLEIAKVRGCLQKGGEADCMKAANLLLDDYRSAKLGRMTLESPKD